MLLDKVYFYVRLILVLAVISVEGKSRRRKRDNQADEPIQEEESPSGIENLCDIKSPVIIYCYCNVIDKDKADEGNCWIFNDTSEESFEDVWEGFATQTHLSHLTLHLRPDGTLKKIPTIAILHLPELQWFEVQYATIHTVQSYAFGNSTSLEKISLARNSISVLEPYSFANLLSLTSVTLGENLLTEVNRTVFSNLPKLTHLFIDRNNITNIEDFAFKELKNLKELELFSNQIQAIVPETFKGLYALERLDLHKNWIEVLGDMTFQDLKSLLFLDLKGNSIKYIAPKSLYGLKKLQRLILQDNKLLSLGSENFKYAGNLLYLDLRQNVLETLLVETMEPLMENLKKPEMNIYLSDNIFRCDTRLLWIFSLYNTTKSRNVRLALEDVYCYLEFGTLPPRLEDIAATPMYEITTLGIGPRTPLLKLRPSELPDPLLKTPATFTEDCDEDHQSTKGIGSTSRKHLLKEDETKHRMKNRKGKLRKKHRHPTEQTVVPSSQQNDMAVHSAKQKAHIEANAPRATNARPEMQPAAPVQESRSHDDSKASAFNAAPLSFVVAIVVSVFSLVR